MQGETPLVWVEGSERRRARHVCNPGAGLDAPCNLGNGSVGDADEDEVGVVAQVHAPLAQASRDGRTDAA